MGTPRRRNASVTTTKRRAQLESRATAKYNALDDFARWDIPYRNYVPTLAERAHHRRTPGEYDEKAGARVPPPFCSSVSTHPSERPTALEDSQGPNPAVDKIARFVPIMSFGHGLTYTLPERTAVTIAPDRGPASIVVRVPPKCRGFILQKTGHAMTSLGLVAEPKVPASASVLTTPSSTHFVGKRSSSSASSTPQPIVFPIRPLEMDLTSVTPYVIGDDPELRDGYYTRGEVNSVDGHTAVTRMGEGTVCVQTDLERGGRAITMTGVPTDWMVVLHVCVVINPCTLELLSI